MLSWGCYTVDYCYPIVINQTLYNIIRALLDPCGNSNTTCTPSCPAALRALAASVGCCWAELVYVNPDTTVTYTTAAEWANCGVPFPGECGNPFTIEASTTSSIATLLTPSPVVTASTIDTTGTVGTIATAVAFTAGTVPATASTTDSTSIYYWYCSYCWCTGFVHDENSSSNHSVVMFHCV